MDNESISFDDPQEMILSQEKQDDIQDGQDIGIQNNYTCTVME